MKTIYRSLLAIAATLTFAACNLDLYPSDSIVYDGKAPLIQTANDLETWRWANYAYFRSTLGGGYDIADDLMCDGFNATHNYGNNYGPIHRADKSFTSSDSDVEGFWANNYSAIGNYNLMIAEVAKNTDPALRDGVKLIAAEANFFRAFTYLKLARRFGPAYNKGTATTDLCVPLVLVYDQQARPERNTVQQVYDQIKQDIDSALKVLGTVKGEASSQLVTADVINALLANWYLDTQDYKKAYETADAIISGGTYKLINDITSFKTKYFEDGGTNGDTESLMRLYASVAETPNGYSSAYTGITADPNSPKKKSYKAYFLPSGRLVDSYDNAKDFRYQAWFEFVGDIPFSSGAKYFSNSEFCVFVKYKGNLALSSSSIPDGHVAPVPYSLGEIYLIAAEAAAKGGESKIKGLSKLTALQNARNGNVSSSLTLEAVQNEWFKETCGEGKRIECLKRWGIACPERYAQQGALDNDVLESTPADSYYERTLPAGAYQYTWPIPSYEIKVNPNLVQNIGY